MNDDSETENERTQDLISYQQLIYQNNHQQPSNYPIIEERIETEQEDDADLEFQEERRLRDKRDGQEFVRLPNQVLLDKKLMKHIQRGPLRHSRQSSNNEYSDVQ